MSNSRKKNTPASKEDLEKLAAANAEAVRALSEGMEALTKWVQHISDSLGVAPFKHGKG